jgi:hypothetical protein
MGKESTHEEMRLGTSVFCNILQRILLAKMARASDVHMTLWQNAVFYRLLMNLLGK